MDPAPPDVTALLHAWQQGEEHAPERLFPLLYEALRRQAIAISASNPSATLQPTAVVHEAYLRLAGLETRWESRAHFFAVAAVIMRRILVDAARSRTALKRGAGYIQVPFADALAAVEERGVDLLHLHDSLNRLAEVDPRQAQIVELRFFGGLADEEIAALLGISTKTVQRGWALARAWLEKYLHPH